MKKIYSLFVVFLFNFSIGAFGATSEALNGLADGFEGHKNIAAADDEKSRGQE